MKNVIIVTKPRPPICISSAITACPNTVQLVKVSATMSPVTQVAEVAVNRQSKNDVLPLFEENGSHSSSVPARIIIRNPRHSVRAGCMGFAFLMTGMCSPRCHAAAEAAGSMTTGITESLVIFTSEIVAGEPLRLVSLSCTFSVFALVTL